MNGLILQKGHPTGNLHNSFFLQIAMKKKKKNLFLFDHYLKTIHTYTLSMSYINNQNNTNIKKIIANMVIMRIINNYNLGSGDSSKTRLVAIEEPPIRKFNVHNNFVI